MIDLKKINNIDPLKRMVEKDSGVEELSPMDPPEAYDLPTTDTIPYEEMNPVLQKLIDEHDGLKAEMDVFEKSLIAFKANGWKTDSEIDKNFVKFFSFMDDQLVKHQLKEEKLLFPLLQQRLLEKKEHSNGSFPKSAIDMLEDDHVKINQHLTLMFNFNALAARLPDVASRALTFDVATEQGFSLIELLKLHIFREENIIFPKANQYITKDEFEKMLKQFNTYQQY
jgi:hemerythrin-like domain-containing protein